MPFKLSNLNSNLALTLGYLNPALNNSALVSIPGIQGYEELWRRICPNSITYVRKVSYIFFTSELDF